MTSLLSSLVRVVVPKTEGTEVVGAAVSVVNPLELEGLVVLAASPKLKPLGISLPDENITPVSRCYQQLQLRTDRK